MITQLYRSIFCCVVISIFISGCTSPKMLNMPLGAEMMSGITAPDSTINFNNLIPSLSSRNWLTARDALFTRLSGVGDYRLPGMLLYRNANGNWSTGMAYDGNGNLNNYKNAQLLFDERGIWVIALSSKNPQTLDNQNIIIKVPNPPPTPPQPILQMPPQLALTLNDGKYKVIDSNQNIVIRDSIMIPDPIKNPTSGGWVRTIISLDTIRAAKPIKSDTIGYSIHRTSLAYAKPIGDIGLSSLISIAASLVFKAAPPTDQQPTSAPDSIWTLSQWRTLSDASGDTIYFAMKKFQLTPGTLNRVSVTPTVIRNGIAVSDDVGSKSNLFSVNNTFENADPSILNIGIGIGLTNGSPQSIGNYPNTNGYLLLNVFFDRPILPLDNRSWGPCVGLGLTSGLFNHIFLGGQSSLSALPFILTRTFQFSFLAPLANELLKNTSLNFGWNYPMWTPALIATGASWLALLLEGKISEAFSPFLPDDWFYGGPGSIRIMAGGDYGGGRRAQCLIGLSYDL
jgi:hypothetical protein